MKTLKEIREGRAHWHYVYQLHDPRTGRCFYVGQGTRRRLEDHELQCHLKKGGPKQDLIREILDSGLRVEKRIVALFDSRHKAREYELALIHEIGYENLTNGGTADIFGPYWRKVWAIRRGTWKPVIQ